MLSSREEASPPRTAAPTDSGTASSLSMPGTAQLRVSRVLATRSCMVLTMGADRVGTSACAGVFTGPRGMAPKYFCISGRAVASSMSPDSTTMALFGP